MPALTFATSSMKRNARIYGSMAMGCAASGARSKKTYIKLADQMAKRETLALIHGRVIDLEQNAAENSGRSAGNAGVSHRTAPADFIYQGRARGTGRQGGAIRPAGIFSNSSKSFRKKDPETYGGLVHKHKIVKTHGWMIGNSPRSDINPAMKIGLNAVYIPHQHTWTLEHETGGGGLRKTGDPACLPGTSRSFLNMA